MEMIEPPMALEYEVTRQWAADLEVDLRAGCDLEVDLKPYPGQWAQVRALHSLHVERAAPSSLRTPLVGHPMV